MNGKHLFLTSAGLTDKMKEKFFDIIGKCPKDVKVLYIPTAGIETDGARESLAICFHELFLMGIQYENILVYNLELILSKDYQRTYSSYVTTPFMLTRLLTFEELNQFDAVFVSGGDVSVLCREMSRTGFDRILNNAIKNGLIYVGISAGSMYAAGNLTDGLHIIDNPIIPHWNGSETTVLPNGKDEIKLADGKAVYVEDNYMSVICGTCRISQIPVCGEGTPICQNPKSPLSVSIIPAAVRLPKPLARYWPQMCLKATRLEPKPNRRSIRMLCA